ncbi:MAG TPA: PAS domain S-box protein, partial [Thermoanaerobaculia bacterium]|nr:PAS domain S-box protein [Thermoanaerobaculia bacterium]
EKDEGTLDREIARSQRAEAALRESERRFFELIELSEDLICTHDLGGRILSVNPVMVRQMGYSREELVGRSLADFLSPETSHEFPGYLESIARDGHAEGFMRVVTSTGEHRVFQYENVLRVIERGDSVVFGVAHDVQRKWAEQALRISVNRLEALLNNIPDAAWMKDEIGRYTAVNEAFAIFLNRPRDELIGKTDFDLSPPALAERYQAEDRSVLSTGEILRVSEDLVGFDGRRVLFETIKTPIRGGAGRPSGTVGIARDISERRRLEEQLVQSQKMEAVGRLAGGIAHDFNNLLTMILGYSDLALGQLAPDSPIRAEIQEISKAGERAAALTRQLLAFSRKQIVEPRVLALNEVVTDLGKMLRRLIGEDIELVTTLEPALHNVRADLSQIEQVLMNLAVNARDAMPGGGRLVIETRNVESYEPYLSAPVKPPPRSDVLLVVSDSGAGMDVETQRHIFEPFYTTKERGKGTGLGLATVYGIVKQSGGDIRVHSELGKGTRFEVFLPRVDEAVEGVELASAGTVQPGGSERVLVVEDEQAVRALARRVLEASGYTVFAAADADEALEIFRRHSGEIDLLLTDVIMPKTSGPRLAQRLLIELPRMKVLYMSGYADAEIAERGILHAETALLQKPFTPERLVQRVREILDSRR